MKKHHTQKSNSRGLCTIRKSHPRISFLQNDHAKSDVCTRADCKRRKNQSLANPIKSETRWRVGPTQKTDRVSFSIFACHIVMSPPRWPDIFDWKITTLPADSHAEGFRLSLWLRWVLAVSGVCLFLAVSFGCFVRCIRLVHLLHRRALLSLRPVFKSTPTRLRERFENCMRVCMIGGFRGSFVFFVRIVLLKW